MNQENEGVWSPEAVAARERHAEPRRRRSEAAKKGAQTRRMNRIHADLDRYQRQREQREADEARQREDLRERVRRDPDDRSLWIELWKFEIKVAIHDDDKLTAVIEEIGQKHPSRSGL
jgi:hypothetical protein